MTGPVTARHDAGLCIITTDHPPLNVLSAAVRHGLVRAIAAANADPTISAILLTCAGKTAFSGADISEFGAPIAQPDLPALITAVAASAKPITVALHGRVLGGGLELALAARARIAAAEARMGLPEIRLGLVPGCGGVERVVQIAGAGAALDLAISGREVAAPEALTLGLIDAVAGADLLADAVALARNPPPARAPRPDADAAATVDTFMARNAFRLRGQDAPREVAALVTAAATDPDVLSRGLGTAAFHRLEAGPQSRALRHLFTAERRVRDLPFLPPDTQALPVQLVGIVGAGTMGSGIATALLLAGLRVVIHDSTPAARERGAALVRDNLAGAVRRGKLAAAALDDTLARLALADDLADLGAADLIIEAVYEEMAVKQAVFARLDQVARPDAVLATNTSFLDIDAIAAATKRPERVVGMHFFSPAHVMRLLEVVRGARTAPAVIATAMALGQRIGKIAVCVGNCHGFVGNRILLRRQDAAMDLLLAGVSPYDIDRTMVDFGLPMGPFAMADLAGLDVGWDRAASAGRTVTEVLCEAGRLGRKNGRGYYDYDDKGRAQPAPAALELIAGFRARTDQTTAPPLTDAAILERLLGPMLDEVGRIIAEGIVIRPSDIDVIWVHGYGWPAWRGGPAWWRDHRPAPDAPA